MLISTPRPPNNYSLEGILTANQQNPRFIILTIIVRNDRLKNQALPPAIQAHPLEP